MRFEGQLYKPNGKNDKFWGVEIPILHIHTQGRTRKEAYEMAKDAIESLVYKKGFTVTVYPGKGDMFTVDANEPQILIAFMLKQQRQFRGLALREVAARLHSKSPNAYAQYEQGRINPSIGKLVELLKAIDPDFEPVLKAGAKVLPFHKRKSAAKRTLGTAKGKIKISSDFNAPLPESVLKAFYE